jgi:hypothetical protein
LLLSRHTQSFIPGSYNADVDDPDDA